MSEDLNKNSQEKNTRTAKIIAGIGALAVAYAGFYLLQHGLDPNLSKKSTLRVASNNLTKYIPFLKNRSDQLMNTSSK